ncbi:MAG TPA: DUF4404 family protein [Steroidobacteraceae bacterium]
MEKDSLHALAAKLHAELSEALRADPKSRESLSEMMRDINRLIDKPAVSPVPAPVPAPASPPGAWDRSLPDRLEKIAVQFEVNHPTLAASARRLVDLLGEVGI